jgi:hypothetical protein
MNGLVFHGHLPSLVNQTLNKPYKDLGPKPQSNVNKEQIGHKQSNNGFNYAYLVI